LVKAMQADSEAWAAVVVVEPQTLAQVVHHRETAKVVMAVTGLQVPLPAHLLITAAAAAVCVPVDVQLEVKRALAAEETGLETDTPVAIPRHQIRAAAVVVETAVVELKTVAPAS
jgi:hypothetical protein